MTTTAELRDRVIGMDSQDCRNELIRSLELLGQLEADFAVLCREVACLRFDKRLDRYNTTRSLSDVIERRSIELP